MAKKKAEKSTEKVASEHPGTENLVPVRTKEEARERGRKGGLKSAEVRRQKKTMREMAKGIMETTVSEQMGNARSHGFGRKRYDIPSRSCCQTHTESNGRGRYLGYSCVRGTDRRTQQVWLC